MSLATHLSDALESSGGSLTCLVVCCCRDVQEMEVIYLVTPTAETVTKICEDFADPKRPKYGAVHLFFLSKVRTLVM
jgi:hypothetical protein